jgi:hypothetical protein
MQEISTDPHQLAAWLADAEAASQEAPAYTVGSIDDRFVIVLADGSAITNPDDVRTFVIDHHKENIMSKNQNPAAALHYADLEAGEATGLVERYSTALAPVRWLAAGAASASEVNKVRRNWQQLARTETVGRTTMDTDPEIPGRPRASRPGVDQIVSVALPTWHPQFRPNEQEVAVLLYRPVTTYLAEVIEDGQLSKVERASAYDTSGYLAVVEYLPDLAAAEQLHADLYAAVRSMSAPARMADSLAGEYDPTSGGLTSPDSW